MSGGTYDFILTVLFISCKSGYIHPNAQISPFSTWQNNNAMHICTAPIPFHLTTTQSATTLLHGHKLRQERNVCSVKVGPKHAICRQKFKKIWGGVTPPPQTVP